jgi:hypothetical protein
MVTLLDRNVALSFYVASQSVAFGTEHRRIEERWVRKSWRGNGARSWWSLVNVQRIVRFGAKARLGRGDQMSTVKGPDVRPQCQQSQ